MIDEQDKQAVVQFRFKQVIDAFAEAEIGPVELMSDECRITVRQ